jgi:hypothetical protein
MTTHIQTTTNNLKLFAKIMLASDNEELKHQNRLSYNQKKRLRIFEWCSEGIKR